METLIIISCILGVIFLFALVYFFSKRSKPHTNEIIKQSTGHKRNSIENDFFQDKLIFIASEFADNLQSLKMLDESSLTDCEKNKIIDMLYKDTTYDGTLIEYSELFFQPLMMLLYNEQYKDIDLSFKYLQFVYGLPDISFTKTYYCQLALISEFYKLRDNEIYLNRCIELCLENINILPIFLSQTQDIVSLPAIKRLAIIYEKQNRFHDALEIALIGSILDKTGDYATRILRLNKKLNNDDKSTHNLDIFYTYDDIKTCKDLSNLVKHINNNIQKKAFGYRKSLSFIDDYTVIDVETTGLNYKSDAIIEIGAIRYRNNLKNAEFHTLINPEFPIPTEATKINNITDDMVKNSPTILDKIDEFLEFLGNDTLIGHNVSFDIHFILSACYKLLMPNPNFKTINTLTLAHKYIDTNSIDDFSLETIKNYLGLNYQSHRSIDDCLITNELYQYCYSKFKAKHNMLDEAASDMIKENTN